ncbi:MAG: hypothetical protein ACRDFT_00750 [bacterium]
MTRGLTLSLSLTLMTLVVGHAAGISWGGPAPTGVVVTFQTVDTGQTSGVRAPTEVVIRDASAWGELWRRHAGARPAPTVDFGRDMVVAAFTGVSQDASGLWITRIVRESDRLTVYYALVDSKPVSVVQAAPPALPFHIVRLPRSMAPVWFSVILTKR